MAAGENYLIISDLQIPFEHNDALKFCRYLKKHYKIKDENVYNVGDELDEYWGGMWKKSPEAKHSALTELYEARLILKDWYKAFPKMKICISNHGTRYWRKALDAEIPGEFIKRYEDVFNFPKDWKIKKHWRVNSSKKKFMVEHGDDYGSQKPHVLAALHNGMSTAIGHHHSKCATEHVVTNGLDIWGMVTGSLIDFEAYAFNYARAAKFKPVGSAGIVVDGGLQCFTIRL